MISYIQSWFSLYALLSLSICRSRKSDKCFFLFAISGWSIAGLYKNCNFCKTIFNFFNLSGIDFFKFKREFSVNLINKLYLKSVFPKLYWIMIEYNGRRKQLYLNLKSLPFAWFLLHHTDARWLQFICTTFTFRLQLSCFF